MTETSQTQKKNITPDWLVQGILTRLGDMFDKLIGRGWTPSSSLATSGLIERLKSLLDSEVKENALKAKFVPHNIKLKMEWDKFSTDAENALKILENELLTAAVDHINDRRYFTYAPLSIEVKPDYFTSGVKFYASFEKFGEEEEHREAELNVTVPGMKLSDVVPETPARSATLDIAFSVKGVPVTKRIQVTEGRRVSVGRTKENAITIDDASVSKVHASLMLNADGRLVIADTGSTNGTFINDERLAYGKAVVLNDSDNLKLGAVEVSFAVEFAPEPETSEPEEKYTVGEFEFASRSEAADKGKHLARTSEENTGVAGSLESEKA